MKRQSVLLFAYCVCVATAGEGPRKIALTFDDLPMTVVGNDHIAGPLAETQDICRSVLLTLQAHHATAIGFVNEVKLNVQGERDARAALLEEWLAAKMMLGNHGYDHLAFSKVGLAAYEEQFLRGDSITNVLLDQHHITERYFRHPYIDTGKTASDEKGFAEMLAAHHYRIAPQTVENYDWMFNASYNDARNRGDQATMSKVIAAYVQQTEARLEHAEQLSSKTFSREIPLIILMHADRINADHLDDVLKVMEGRGINLFRSVKRCGIRLMRRRICMWVIDWVRGWTGGRLILGIRWSMHPGRLLRPGFRRRMTGLRAIHGREFSVKHNSRG